MLQDFRAPVPAKEPVARKRATELLRTLLTPDELKHLDQTGTVLVVGPVSGRVWELGSWSVRLDAATKRDWDRFPMTCSGAACCIHIRSRQNDALRPGDVKEIDSVDNTIVNLLAIKTNERAFVWAIPSLSLRAKAELVGPEPRKDPSLVIKSRY